MQLANRPSKHFIGLIGALLLGVIAKYCWIYEIIATTGWHGLAWLNGDHLAMIVPAVITAFTFLLPSILSSQLKKYKGPVAFVLLSVLNAVFYYWGKEAMCIAFGRWILPPGPIFPLKGLLGLVLAVALCYWTIYRFLINRIKLWHFGWVLLGLALIYMGSEFCMSLFDGRGSESGWIGAVKNGYPMAMTVIVMYGVGWVFDWKRVKEGKAGGAA